MYLVDGYIDVFIAACEFVGLVWFGLVWFGLVWFGWWSPKQHFRES
jgi:hypothetical protein